jgi:hypothetical protein
LIIIAPCFLRILYAVCSAIKDAEYAATLCTEIRGYVQDVFWCNVWGWTDQGWRRPAGSFPDSSAQAFVVRSDCANRESGFLNESMT